MTLSYGAQYRADDVWDIGRLVYSNQAFQGTAALAPTAVTPASWFYRAQTEPSYLYRLAFSTDTAIGWTLVYFLGDWNLTAGSIRNLKIGTATSANKFEAAVSAPGGVTGTFDSGFAPANSRTEILFPSWIGIPTAWGVGLYTSAVAANCSATFSWCEMLD